MNVNNCDELQFASRITKAQLDFEQRNRIYRWKVVANLDKFGLKNIEIKQRNIPFINNPYENVDWERISYSDAKRVFKINRNDNILGAPKVVSILVKIIRRKGKVMVICENPKHKQKQG